MTITPIPKAPPSGLQVNGTKRPAFMSPQVIASDEGTFLEACLQARKQALEGIERSLQQLQQRKEQLALHWLYVSLQQTLSPHLTN